ncbi:hypothetical protein ACU8NH_09375 [Rhizobium leguminosarum]
MGAVTRDLALAQLVREPVITFQRQPYNEPVMVEGYGAQPVPPPAANDNVPVSESAVSRHVARELKTLRHSIENASGEWDLMRSQSSGEGQGGYDIPPALQPAFAALIADRGEFIQVYPDRKFYPFSPRPEEVFIESIAHGLSNICRYSGAGNRSYSVAEHSTLIARYLASRYAPEVALAGLLHDAPEALSGFGDVGRPVKDKAPIISETEDGIYRLAVAPRFGLPLDIPAEVHEADRRIIGDEVAANLAPMEWHARYDDPLGVWIRCWSAEKAEAEFMATFHALTYALRVSGRSA